MGHKPPPDHPRPYNPPHLATGTCHTAACFEESCEGVLQDDSNDAVHCDALYRSVWHPPGTKRLTTRPGKPTDRGIGDGNAQAIFSELWAFPIVLCDEVVLANWLFFSQAMAKLRQALAGHFGGDVAVTVFDGLVPLD